MASSPTTLNPQHNVFLLPAITKLSIWRFKQMWRFLLVTWLGMLAMVVLVCALPLFSRVSISADIRSLATSSTNGTSIQVEVASTHASSSQIQQVAQQVDHLLHQGHLNPYLQGTPQFSVKTPLLTISPASQSASSALFVDGYDMTQVAQRLTLVHGRLPQATTTNTIEIALAQSAATALNVQLGSTFQGHFSAMVSDQPWTFQVVGIIAPGLTHDPLQAGPNSPFSITQIPGSTVYTVLAPIDVIKSRIENLQATPNASGRKDAFFANTFHLSWSYPFDISHLDANDIDTLAQQLSTLPDQLQTTVTQIPDVLYAFPTGDLFNTLSNYGSQIVLLEVVITLLILLTLAIVLFLVSMLSDLLVERQAGVIATLRSRGATRRHIFGTFLVQSIVLSLAALLAGPFLAILLVRLIAQTLLSADNQQALSVITNNPLQSVLDVKWFAIIAVAISLFVMIIAIHRASKQDIVTLRRESSRIKRVPLWRRLNLDLLLVLLIVVGYSAYTYFWQTVTASTQVDSKIYLLVNLLAFVAPGLVVAAVLLLFLRLFPLISRMTTALASKKRTAPAILAFAQMERTPRPAARMIVLLALAIASSSFLFTLAATKEARTSDAATFAVTADFSGLLPETDQTKTLSALKTQYSHLPSVLSATIAYHGKIEPDPNSPMTSNASGPITLQAIDADTYAQTALWPAQTLSQPLSNLTAQLVAHRADASSHNVVYALVDAALWQSHHLSQGAAFTLPMNNAGTLQIQFIAMAKVDYIPGLFDTPLAPNRGVGLMVDYQSYATVYNKANDTPLSPNTVLLRTKDDDASLASIRHQFPELQDRRMLTTSNQNNTVHLDIIGVLCIAIGAALILALIGSLLSSWLNASSRRTNFAVIRALGMPPRQVAAVLLWEQSFIYILALLLGSVMATLLAIFAAPIVFVLDAARPGTPGNFYDVPPVQTTIPYPLLTLVLGGIVLICLVALLLMARIVSRPSLGQTLRLNED